MFKKVQDWLMQRDSLITTVIMYGLLLLTALCLLALLLVQR